MKITRNNKVFDLTPAQEVPLTLTNPLFNDTGSFSYPFETPATPATLAALGFPNRPDRLTRYVSRSPATLEHGLLRLSGTHNISAVDQDQGTITHDFIADEGAFYEEIGDRMLSEVMSTKIPARSTDATPDQKYAYLLSLLQAANRNAVNTPLQYDYAAFPVCISAEANDTGGTTYTFLNKTDANGNIVYGTTDAGGMNINGISPFLFVRTIIREVMAYYKFTITDNPFIDDIELQMAVVLNNTIDALVPGSISYADLVPTITVNTFIKGVEAQFGCKFFIDYRLRTVSIRMLNDIFKAAPVKDFTALLSSPITMGYDEPKKLVLTVDRSFSRSAVKGDSFDQLYAETHPTESGLQVEDFTYQRQQYERNVMYAVNRQNFYITDLVSSAPNDYRYRYNFLSSPFFDYNPSANLDQFKVEIEAEAVNIINARDDTSTYLFIDVPSFESEARRLHPVDTPGVYPVVDGYGNKECPLGFVVLRGWVDAFYWPDLTVRREVKYLFASSFNTHPVANIEGPGGAFKIVLTPESIRDLYYIHYEEFLAKSNIPATCGIDMTAVAINNNKWWEKIWLAGQPYFIDKINLTMIGDSDIRIDSVELRTARLYGLPSGKYVFTATPDVLNAPAAAMAEYEITIDSTFAGNPVEWEVASKSSVLWMLITGQTQSTLKIWVGQNVTGTAHTAYIFLSQKNSPEPNITITINQAAT